MENLMVVHVQGITNTGIKGTLTVVECHLCNGILGIVVVGFANKAVD